MITFVLLWNALLKVEFSSGTFSLKEPYADRYA